ncbi:hypothetical protein [Streptomyces sp. NPDC051211]|uniref:hypothetical protein n=1 Tax=Streptomyces sp. NPDC051211 TaxID=3154643 RepID=UPI00344B6703
MPESSHDHDRILEVLDRLLYDASVRTVFIEHGPADPRLGLEPELVAAFERVDVRELALVGRNIRSEVVGGGTGTGPGLARTFARSLEVIRERTGRTPNEVAELFVASPEFGEFRDVPFSPAGRGRLLPECFHRFVAGSPPPLAGVEPLVHHEAAVGVAQAVATGAEATFEVGLAGFAVHGGVHCAFREYAEAPAGWALEPTLYLAAPGRCVTGRGSRPLFDALVAVLAGRGGELAPRVRDSLESRLRTWGLR